MAEISAAGGRDRQCLRYYIVNYTDVNLTMRIPFWSRSLSESRMAGVSRYCFFAVIGTVNGVNFTDGLDGLASSVTLIVAVFFYSGFYRNEESGIEPITCAVVGGLMGFLLFNVYPAKVFMGDTGSLALGGFVAGSCLYDADAVVYPAGRTDLSGRGTVRYHPGNLFQENPWKTYF